MLYLLRLECCLYQKSHETCLGLRHRAVEKNSGWVSLECSFRTLAFYKFRFQPHQALQVLFFMFLSFDFFVDKKNEKKDTAGTSKTKDDTSDDVSHFIILLLSLPPQATPNKNTYYSEEEKNKEQTFSFKEQHIRLSC